MKRHSLVCLFVLAATGSAQDMPLSQVLIPGENWVAVPTKAGVRALETRIRAVAADAGGNPIIARSGAGIGTLTREGYKEFAAKAKVSAMCWSPEGVLLTLEDGKLYSRSAGEEVRKITDGVFDFTVSPKGPIYYTALDPDQVRQPNVPPRKTIFQVGHPRPVVSTLPTGTELAGLAFWRDGGTLVVGDSAGDRLITFRVGKDGGLDAGEGYYTLRTRDRDPSKVAALTLDTDGRLYAATAEGVQVFDPTGRMCGVINAPARAGITSMVFAGPARDQLYVVCDGKLFARKTKAKGFVPAAK